ncbi:MAG: hypothetical protein ABFD57_02955 [Smithella sp.]
MKKILLLLLLTVVFAVPAFSQMSDMPMRGQVRGHGQMMEMGNMYMMDCHMMCMENENRMGLTDDQMMKIRTLHREMQKKQIKFKADLQLAEIELMEIMEVKDFDLEKATATVKKIEGIKTAQHLEMLKAMKNIRPILTDEQFKNMHKICMMPVDKKHEKIMNKSKPIMKKPSPKKPAN